MKLKLSQADMEKTFKSMLDTYKVMAPVKKPFKGTMSDTDAVRYEEVTTFDQIEFGEKSQFSAREIIQPITQVLFYFTEEDYKIPKAEEKKILVFLRACDIHAMDRVDQIYLGNGPVDPYYKQIRDRVEFALIGCEKSFRNCFCASMGTNKADQYALGVKPIEDGVCLDIKAESIKSLFSDHKDQIVSFEMDFVKNNDIQVELASELDAQMIADHDMFREYDARCVACGKCNFVCPTCTCFSMQDIFYRDNENTGERRRVWSSCHVDGYTDMAGGHGFRKKHGDRMRFKTLHKVHDYEKRFGKHMCIGCGRAMMRVPSTYLFQAV